LIVCKLITIKLKENSGASAARNAGAAEANGEILVFTDSDIVLDKYALKEGLKYRRQNPNVSGFFGMFIPQLRFKNLLSQYKHLYLCHLYTKQGEERSTLDTSLSFINKKLFDQYEFNEKVKISEDADLAMRMIRDGHVFKQNPRMKIEHISHRKNYKD